MSPSQVIVNPDPNGSGYTSPQHELGVHPTSVNRGAPIVVHSSNTVYTPEHITAKFENRGADVVKDAQGVLHVTPTSTAYEIRTERKVPKTGCVVDFSGCALQPGLTVFFCPSLSLLLPPRYSL